MSRSVLNTNKVLILIFVASFLVTIASSTLLTSGVSNKAPKLLTFSNKLEKYQYPQKEGLESRLRSFRELASPRLIGTLSLLFILAPILLLFALPILILLAFIPVPIVPAGRSLMDSFLLPNGFGGVQSQSNSNFNFNSILEALDQVIEMENCVERISCHVFKATGQYGMFEKIFSLLKMLPKNSSLMKRIVRGTNAKRNCVSFKCSSFKKFWSSIHEQQNTSSKS